MVNPDDILRPDNRELFETVRHRLERRNPAEPITAVAADIGVSVDALCRWIIAYREPRKARYQAPRFAPLAPSAKSNSDLWSDDEDRRRRRMWDRARKGAAEAMAAK